MSGATRDFFFFVRHAETDWNQKNLCQGQRDIPLNTIGKSKAKQFAQSTANLHFECIISSPLLRALQTAEELRNIHTKAQFHLISELSERNWGALEGISSQEMYCIEKREDQDPAYETGHRVERRDVFQKRVELAIKKAQSLHPHPLIVSHGRVFTELCHLLKIPPIQQIPNCRLVKFLADEGKWDIQFI